jgi:hypothetical protein
MVKTVPVARHRRAQWCAGVVRRPLRELGRQARVREACDGAAAWPKRQGGRAAISQM